MRIALATCSDLPAWEVDDRPLRAALAGRGVEVAEPAWDDPGVDWGAFDACLIRTTWDYMERWEAYVDWAERVAGLTRLFNPAAVVRWNTDKRYLERLAEAGLPVVPIVRLARGSRPPLARWMAERGWSRGFIKPRIGATSRETLRFDADAAGLAAASQHLERLLAREDALLQPYLASVETAGERSLVFLDGRFSHAVRKLPPPGDYRVQDDFGASDEPVAPEPAELELTARAVALAEKVTGSGPLLYARADFLRDDAGAPRFTELELVEPSLFFRHAPAAAGRLADALLRRIATAERRAGAGAGLGAPASPAAAERVS